MIGSPWHVRLWVTITRTKQENNNHHTDTDTDTDTACYSLLSTRGISSPCWNGTANASGPSAGGTNGYEVDCRLWAGEAGAGVPVSGG